MLLAHYCFVYRLAALLLPPAAAAARRGGRLRGLQAEVEVGAVSPRAQEVPDVLPEEDLGATKKGGVVNLRFIISLDLPYVNICLLVWDSGLQLIYEN